MCIRDSFKGTVRDNLRMGQPGASDDELWTALTQVNLADFLKREAGLDTLLAERGENLSGGQRQRLALARALLHDSPVSVSYTHLDVYKRQHRNAP